MNLVYKIKQEKRALLQMKKETVDYAVTQQNKVNITFKVYECHSKTCKNTNK